MDVFTPISFTIDLFGKMIGAVSNRPHLKIDIISFRPDLSGSRWIFRSSVMNYGRIIANNCEGFWSLFDENLKEITCGMAVFWSPKSDNDYDYKHKERRATAIEFNERRFCWAEIDITPEPIKDTTYFLFPYDGSKGIYTLAMIVEYGQYKSFDLIELSIPSRITLSTSPEILNENINWYKPHFLKRILKRWHLGRHIKRIDYHNYIRLV
jgi:hypothetical protein